MRRVVRAQELTDEELALIHPSEVSAEHAHLDAELDVRRGEPLDGESPGRSG